MSIWYNKDLTIEQIKSIDRNNMAGALGIEFHELGDDYLIATMPVDERTRQPYGLLHGGASCVLAETLGSVASAMIIDREKFYCVGLEINANHIRSVKDGFVTGTASPIHIGGTTHVWDIRIVDHRDKLVCISRLTVIIMKL